MLVKLCRLELGLYTRLKSFLLGVQALEQHLKRRKAKNTHYFLWKLEWKVSITKAIANKFFVPLQTDDMIHKVYVDNICRRQ